MAFGSKIVDIRKIVRKADPGDGVTHGTRLPSILCADESF